MDVFDVESPWVYADLSTALRGLRSSGVAARAVGNTSENAVNEAHINALSPLRMADGSYEVGATFRCLLAQAR